MADVKINCPKCGGHVAFPKEMAGQEGSCPHCNENIILPKQKRAPTLLLTAIGGFVLALVVLVFAFTHHALNPQHKPVAAKSEFEVLQDKAATGDQEAMVKLGHLYLFGNGVLTNTEQGFAVVGNTIPTNSEKALEWLQKAVERGNPHAMAALGAFYYSQWQSENSSNTLPLDPNTGLPIRHISTESSNYTTFLRWSTRAAELEETNAMWQLIYNEDLSNTNMLSVLDPNTGLPMLTPDARSLPWLKKLANLGDSAAMVMLGSFELNETNTENGLGWLQKAADLEDTTAWSTLASTYASGSGGTATIPLRYEKAVYWYTKCATNGDASSAMHLAELYRDNEEVKNLQESFKWFLQLAKAYSGSNPVDSCFEKRQALLEVAHAYEKGVGVDRDETEAVKWYQKSADAGDCEAEWRLGVVYDLGKGVQIDKQKALQWYLKAANTRNYFKFTLPGVAESQRNLGYLYRDGDGVAKDNREAFNWFVKAAKNGDDTSQYELAKAYDTGVGVLQDKEEALKWYQKSAFIGNKSAQMALGNLYSDNLYSSQNRIAAYMWYSLAAAQGDQDAAKLRDIAAKAMNAQELSEAKRQAIAFSMGQRPTNNVPLGSSAGSSSAGIDFNKPAFEVMNITARATEQNDVFWRYGYRLTVRNNGINSDGQWFEIQFLDAQGYVIYSTTTDRTIIRPGSTGIITGDTLVSLPGAGRVSKLKAVWKE